MNTLSRRVSALEQAKPTILSPASRRWLGHPLTAAEAREADGEEAAPLDLASVASDPSISLEVKQWLGAI